MSVEAILNALGVGFLNLGKSGFLYGPQGFLLRRNVEALWFQHCVTMPRYNVFLTSGDRARSTLEYLRSAAVDDVPLGLASLEDCDVGWNPALAPRGEDAHRIAKLTVISDEGAGKDLFHVKQRERKVWWRKLARRPSTFVSTDPRKTENDDTVEIQARFPFGNVLVETIAYRHNTERRKDDHTSGIEAAEVIECVSSIDWGCLAFICDGYAKENDSDKLYVHPKLSPYKVAFRVDSTTDTDVDSEDLNRLVLYLNNLLRGKGLDTILTYNEQSIQAVCVPFVITLDSNSLKNGIVNVTSRLTTLSEKVHVSKLIDHIVAHCS